MLNSISFFILCRICDCYSFNKKWYKIFANMILTLKINSVNYPSNYYIENLIFDYIMKYSYDEKRTQERMRERERNWSYEIYTYFSTSNYGHFLYVEYKRAFSNQH